MTKNKRDWSEINTRKGKRYNDRNSDTENSKRREEKPPKSRRPYDGEKNRPAFESFEEYRENPNMVIGRNPVIELLKNDRDVDKLFVAKGSEGSINKILAMAKEKGIVTLQADKIVLDRMCDGKTHQGVVALASAHNYAEMSDVFAKAEQMGEEPFVIILDNLEDPHNLGAIMRTAECVGAHGIIIPKRHSCGLTDVVAKASAGAIEYMPCVRVTNIGQAIDTLKESGFWIAACDMDGVSYYKQDLSGKIAMVIGSEGKGIGPLVKKKCDFVVSMPIVGKITSLNASNAAAVVMYEVRRQRDGR